MRNRPSLSAMREIQLPRWPRLAGGLLLVAFTGVSVLLAARWPYSQERMIASIERATGSRVRFEQYRLSFFPEPGCTIENFILERGANQPIAQAAKIDIRSSWLSILTFRKR